jgi:hypothetical protein
MKGKTMELVKWARSGTLCVKLRSLDIFSRQQRTNKDYLLHPEEKETENSPSFRLKREAKELVQFSGRALA